MPVITHYKLASKVGDAAYCHIHATKENDYDKILFWSILEQDSFCNMGKVNDMQLDEMTWDKMLKIRTSGRDDSRADQYRYPYEPTPYSVLERLAASEYIGKRDVLLDYGCGKGRVDFYLSYQTGCHSIGIEYDERIWQAAMDNQKSAVSGRKVQILNVSAEDYVLDPKVSRCYFFNPFSVEILQSVMEQIRDTYYEAAREILLFFYYPSDEYIGWLMQQDDLMFVDEIDCMDLFDGEEERERIMIFELGY